MIKKIKPAILFLIPFLFIQEIYGQIPANMTDYLSQKFLSFCKSVPREEIYIHSDREIYISGEDIWFNIYLIDRQSLKPSGNSKIAYFELLNQENRPIAQKRIWLEKGFGPGQIILPDTLSTGRYTIRAYTSWMKNFLPSDCFTKNIQIYNSFSTRTIKEKIGQGKIKMRNAGAYSYPGTSGAGVTLRADNLKPDVLEVTVTTDEKFRSENNNLFYLFIQTHGIINFVSSEGTSGENTKILIPKKQLTSGINQITVFNSKGAPVGERYIYTPRKENPVLTFSAADSSGPRKKISVGLEFRNELSDTLNTANISISVAPVINNHFIRGIDDYLIFGSEFGLQPWSMLSEKEVDRIAPEVMDSLLQTVRSNWIDWNAILANELPEFKYSAETDHHYLTGKLLTGDQRPAETDSYVLLSPPGKTAVFQYAKTDKDGNFNFKLHIDDKVNDIIIQPAEVIKNQSIRIESSFSDQYLKAEISVDSVNNPVPDYISAWSVNQQVRKIYGTSSTGGPIIRIFSQPLFKRFYGKPDQELIMKDYIALPVMQEVFFELLAGVFLKSKKTGYEITVANPENNKTYDIPPCLFIDGVMIKDPSLIANLDPEAVEIIDVVRGKYFVGDFAFYGIVNVITKSGDFSNAIQPDYAIRLHYRAIDPVLTFVSPDYTSVEMKRSRVPDFRNTLYWNPSVKPDKTGKAGIDFWTSDFVSDVEVNIQGITRDGKAFSLKKIMRVKK